MRIQRRMCLYHTGGSFQTPANNSPGNTHHTSCCQSYSRSIQRGKRCTKRTRIQRRMCSHYTIDSCRIMTSSSPGNTHRTSSCLYCLCSIQPGSSHKTPTSIQTRMCLDHTHSILDMTRNYSTSLESMYRIAKSQSLFDISQQDILCRQHSLWWP
jgi:hypothetical protein